jgi:mRNA interferase MazF
MRRGDVVIVSASGDYGKPRPAVVVQTDALVAADGSVILCQLTSELREFVEFRPTVEPSAQNRLQLRSQIMADKPVTVRRNRIRQIVGRLASEDMRRLDTALAFVLGLAE